MNIKHKTTQAGAVAVLLAISSLLTTTSGAAQADPDAQLRRDTQHTLGLRKAHIVSVEVHKDPSGTFFAAVDLGLPALLRLRPHSVRAPGYRVLAQLEDGSYREAPSSPVRTVRGDIMGIPGSLVAGSLLDEKLYARIRTASGDDLWLEPLADHVAGAGPGQHVLYRNADVLDRGRTCDTDLLHNAQPLGALAAAPSGTSARTMAPQVAELACDADFEYFSRYGSTGAVQSRINAVINTMNVQYETEVSITHQITQILIRTSASQPYTSFDAVTLLNQFRNQWNANHGSVSRDIAHLFTGKSLIGSTIGIAWVGVVCNSSYGYGLVESDFSSNLACTTDLSAHELGHNWNANHCGCRKNTMNSSITCANTFHSRRTVPDIEQFRSSRGCLGGTGGTPTSMSVGSITVSTAGVGGGNKRGRAVVTVVDNVGNPVAGATVVGTFSGSINESGISGVTGASGTVTLNTDGTGRGKVIVTFCVDNVTGSLPYQSSSNAETCDGN